MEFPSLEKVFGKIIEAFSDIVKQGKTERCEVEAVERNLSAWCRFDQYIKHEEIIKLGD